MSVWKTRDETYHGTKWGYAIVALVIIVVLSLLGSIFYLIGEGIKTVEFDPVSIVFWIVIVIIIVIALIILAVFLSPVYSALSPVYGFFASLWSVIWTLFSNIYLLVVVVVLAIIFISMLSIYALSGTPVSLQNPLVIALLIGLLIIFIPFAIFIIDLFSLEHE